jgi:pilus assembly protein Flp/PilA
MNKPVENKPVELNKEEAEQVVGGTTTALEYGLIAAGIGVAIINTANAMGTKLGQTFNNIGTNLKN